MPIVLFKTIEYASRIPRSTPLVETEGRVAAALLRKQKIKHPIQQRDDLSLCRKEVG
ncbi:MULTISPECIES: hypothetical protein [unclassified Ensifer]|uniref:hypothetical protein n=1 Tax=unclassified Ensifer TaxID=2633371 RepID=UPI0013747CA7|nr:MULTISPECIES: hypothetical protein [unclassified Ensifer]